MDSSCLCQHLIKFVVLVVGVLLLISPSIGGFLESKVSFKELNTDLILMKLNLEVESQRNFKINRLVDSEVYR